MTSVFLLPGEYCIPKEPVIIETLIGSCVSVCLYNTRTAQAAMNHFLQDEPFSENNLDIGKYGSTATEYIIKAITKTDPVMSHYRAEIFGGAAVIKTSNFKNNIGQKNIDIARKILTEHDITIVNQEVGGNRGRRVKFNTAANTIQWRYAGCPKQPTQTQPNNR